MKEMTLWQKVKDISRKVRRSIGAPLRVLIITLGVWIGVTFWVLPKTYLAEVYQTIRETWFPVEKLVLQTN